MQKSTFINEHAQAQLTNSQRGKIKKNKNELLLSLNQSDKKTTWESPNQCRNSLKDLNDQDNTCCETLATKLKKTILDRMREDKVNNSRVSSEYNKSIKDLTTDMNSSIEEMKSVKSSLLSLFDSNEKLKQSNKIIKRENNQLTIDIEETDSEVKSLLYQIKKMRDETEMINKEIDREGKELLELKKRERQTAKDNNETIQMKRILTTSIVLARKEIVKIMNEVHGLVKKRATVREELDVLIRTYDY